MTKTTTCGELRREDAGRRVTLMGWVHRRRDHGGIIFIDLRDRWGLTQVVFNPERNQAAYQVATELRPEYVLQVEGVISARPAGMANPRLATGEIEVLADRVAILNPARPLPFEVSEDGYVDEALRLKYRYLDIRREGMAARLVFRSQLIKFIRDYLYARDFIEVETPILVKETPGGAREYLIPSRLYPGRFYALPQSPQQFKQLLMVGGVERYFQVARCFRDEDQRADRQPEFTQLDIEMSFVDQEDILQLTEGLFTEAIDRLAPDRRILARPFPRLTYAEAMDRYGSDKPDLRFGLPLTNLSDLVAGSGFGVFSQTVAAGGQVKGIRAPGCAGYTRKQMDELTEFARAKGARGLVTLALEGEAPRSDDYTWVMPERVRGPAVKFLTAAELQGIAARLQAAPGDLLLIIADQPDKVATALGELRLEIGQRLALMDRNVLAWCWIVEMPLFEWNAEEGHWQSKHHQFTSPMDEDLPFLESDPGRVRAKQYDLVCNGYEVGGGSIRIHRRDLQQQIFKLIGMSEEEARAMFSHLLEAFEYGAPPHGGIAPGIDRIAMLLTGADNIREVICFPKSQSALDLMTGAPSPITPRQYKELHIQPAGTG